MDVWKEMHVKGNYVSLKREQNVGYSDRLSRKGKEAKKEYKISMHLKTSKTFILHWISLVTRKKTPKKLGFFVSRCSL